MNCERLLFILGILSIVAIAIVLMVTVFTYSIVCLYMREWGTLRHYSKTKKDKSTVQVQTELGIGGSNSDENKFKK